MNYNKENHTEDENIANWAYGKYFANFPQFKDELIQEAIIKLWKYRSDFNSAKSKYITWAAKVAYSAMATFLRKQEKFSEDTSFNEENEDMYFSDYLLAEYMPAPAFNIAMPVLLDVIKGCVRRLQNDRAKQIIKLYMNRRSCEEISKIVGIARQNVHAYIRQFREDLGVALEHFQIKTRYNKK